jgi:membrane fusion protein, multidrug efflux system
MLRNSLLVLFLAGVTTAAQTTVRTELAKVSARRTQRTVDLPAEIAPYLATAIEARVAGYVETVLVDRGSPVKKGQLLIQLTAPEMTANVAAAQSNVSLAQADESQAEAQLEAVQSTYDGTKKAAETPGAIAGNELTQAQKQRDAAQSLVNARKGATRAAENALQALLDTQSYLHVTAPFDGIITDRFVHPGALVQANVQTPLLNLQQISRLRVTVPVPEQYAGEIIRGAVVSFHVPAFPQRAYTGKVARIAHSLDEKTRTMSVELDVVNRDRTLAPGMYPTVHWPVETRRPVLLVPASSVVTTTERVFVIKEEDGHALWVDVRKAETSGDQMEVSGHLKAGDLVVLRGTDEIREGTILQSGRDEQRSQ